MKSAVAIWGAVLLMMMAAQRGAAWGTDGHYLVCSIAETMLTASAAAGVKSLLPEDGGQLADWCSWADKIKFRYRWSSPLHFADTEPDSCSFSYARDCQGPCVASAINNYTSQLMETSNESTYNLTEALLFLAHLMGDIHQPLHVGHSDDKGGNTVILHFYRRKENLHHVWDTDIIDRAITTLYDSNLQSFQDDITKKITETNIKQWSSCPNNLIVCPNKYAEESIEAACKWAYADAPADSTLQDSYFKSRLPIIQDRIAHGGVRLASLLNDLFTN